MADGTQELTVMIAHAAFTHKASAESTQKSVASYLNGTIYIYFAIVEEVTPLGTTFLIQTSPQSSGDDTWVTVEEVITGTTATATEAMTATEPIGEKEFAVSSDTGFASGDKIYAQEGGGPTPSEGEWLIVQETGGTTITVFNGLTVQKDSSDVLWTQAETFSRYIDFTGVSRIQVLMLHEGATGPNIEVRVDLLAMTDFE